MTYSLARLQDMVFEALDNAVENGYIEVSGLGAEPHLVPMELAKDLVAFDADLERCAVAELLPFVERWVKAKRLRWENK